MAVLKLSAIATGTTPATTDTVVGVQGGTTDALFTLAQIASRVLTSPTITGTLTAPDSGTWDSGGINSSIIGGTTAAAGTFTSLSATAAGSVGTPVIALTNFETGTGFYVTAAGKMGWTVGGVLKIDYGIGTANDVTITPVTIFSSSVNVGSSSGAALRLTNNAGGIQFRNGNTSITSPNSAVTQLGSADAAAAVAQTLQVQNIVAGTSNVGGANWTQTASLSTGSGLSGDWAIQTGGTGAGAAIQNAPLDGIRVKGGTQTVIIGNAALGTTATDGFLYIPTCAGTPTGVPTTFTGRIPMIFDTTNSQFWFYAGGAWKQPKTPAGAAVVTWQ